ncbi:hypothetical protein AB7X32_20535 [Morganella morganii]|uniref:hypothetical protein n=1 Tax=Morganella morganii TaxID=582 RepID=UPI0031A12B9E
MYFQIGDQIWFAQKRLDGTEPESFFVTGWEEAEDKYGALVPDYKVVRSTTEN